MSPEEIGSNFVKIRRPEKQVVFLQSKKIKQLKKQAIDAGFRVKADPDLDMVSIIKTEEENTYTERNKKFREQTHNRMQCGILILPDNTLVNADPLEYVEENPDGSRKIYALKQAQRILGLLE